MVIKFLAAANYWTNMKSKPSHITPPIAKVKVKLALQQATKTQSGSSGIAVLFPWSMSYPGHFTSKKDPVPIVGKTG
jgi:hypothetical protein